MGAEIPCLLVLHLQGSQQQLLCLPGLQEPASAVVVVFPPPPPPAPPWVRPLLVFPSVCYCWLIGFLFPSLNSSHSTRNPETLSG